MPIPDLQNSSGATFAISYPDGHPSTAEIRRPDSAQDKLRYFASLGWTAQWSDTCHWTTTGHALVVDMEPGRDRQPWIVLASKWPEDSYWEDIEGDGYQYVDEYRSWGVLPGDRKRTIVGKIKAMDSSFQGSILRAFDPNFSFTVARTGSSRGYISSSQGPDLAQIMDWFLDPVTKDFVCYATDGPEYMRRERETGKIVYSKGARKSAAGEIGKFG